MSKKQKTLLVGATAQEFANLINYKQKQIFYETEKYDAFICGIATHNAIFNLTNFLSKTHKKYDYIINIGIAGTFCNEIKKTQLVEVKSDLFADLGIDDNGNFKTLFEENLLSDDNIFINGRIIFNTITSLPKVKAITVNTTTGSIERISKLKKQFIPCIETMEGAAIGFVAKKFNLQISQIRAISNYVEIRNKNNWLIKPAITELENFIKKNFILRAQ